MREITIRPVLNGFMVTVGCQALCFSTMEFLCAELLRYQKNPEEVEKEYLKNAVNKPEAVGRVPKVPIEVSYDEGMNKSEPRRR